MGAIAGWTAGRNAPDETALLPMLQALAHRCPGEGDLCSFPTEGGRRVVFGHALYDEEAGIAVALDGAIANRQALAAQLGLRGYRFSSDDGIEVLARAYQHWDKDVVQQLRGAFAFAIWDARRERLMLARDRFGEKPLYLAEQGGTLYFGSELKALLKAPGMRAQPDPDAVRDYLVWRFVPGPRTLLSGVRKLQPGSYALWQFGRLREQRYWTPPDRTPLATQARRPVEDTVETFAEKLEESVRMNLPAGVLLSGGIDSAALVALAARQGGQVRTFSAGFAGDRASELERAAQVAKHFGTEHQEIVLAPGDVIRHLPAAVAQRDAPISRPADVALHLIAREAARGTRAVLTGDGSDEVLGGYRRYVAEHLGWGLRSVPTLLFLAGPLGHARPRLQTALDSLRTPDWRERYVRWIGSGFAGNPQAGNKAPFDADPNTSSLRRFLYFDQTSWLPDNVLERSDRMTMAASLEARAPFLDHRLVEFVSALPDELRVRGLATKWILRRAARQLLPQLSTRQAGFSIPAGAWMRGELREFLLDALRGGDSMTRPYYDARELDRVLDEHIAGRRDHETLLWTLLNLEIWHRTCLR